MNPEPIALVIFTALVAGSIGFFASALMTSGAIRKAKRDAYWDGFAACNREHDKHRPDHSDRWCLSAEGERLVERNEDGSATYTPPRLRQSAIR